MVLLSTGDRAGLLRLGVPDGLPPAGRGGHLPSGGGGGGPPVKLPGGCGGRSPVKLPGGSPGGLQSLVEASVVVSDAGAHVICTQH